MTDSPRISQDAANVLALADTAVPFAVSLEDEAERWVRVMRMHGQVGDALQGLGVGEAPLETPAARISQASAAPTSAQDAPAPASTIATVAGTMPATTSRIGGTAGTDMRPSACASGPSSR